MKMTTDDPAIYAAALRFAAEEEPEGFARFMHLETRLGAANRSYEKIRLAIVNDHSNEALDRLDRMGGRCLAARMRYNACRQMLGIPLLETKKPVAA